VSACGKLRGMVTDRAGRDCLGWWYRPHAHRKEITEASDETRETLAVLLTNWPALDGGPLTVADLLNRAQSDADLLAALTELARAREPLTRPDSATPCASTRPESFTVPTRAGGEDAHQQGALEAGGCRPWMRSARIGRIVCIGFLYARGENLLR